MLDDAGHIPVVIQKLKRIPDLNVFRRGRQIVDQEVFRALHVVPLQKYKTTRHRAETFWINPVNYIHATLGAKLQERWRDGLHVFQFRQFLANLYRHGRGGHYDECGSSRRLNHDWHVAGIVEHGKGARLFVPLVTLQDLVGAPDKASIFWVKCTRPEHTEDVMDETRHLLPGYTVRPVRAMLTLMTSTNIPGLQAFIDAMISLAVAIGLLVIFLTMYTTVIERTRDIGVLKSLGAGRVFIVRALLTESAGLCVIGIVAGVGLSYAVRAAFLAGFPTLSINITTEWILRAGAIALGGAMLGASYPAWLASRKDPVEALSYD